MPGTLEQLPVLRERYRDATPNPQLLVVCPGFELQAWRASALVEDLFHRHLASFALSYTEFADLDGNTAGRSMSRAAKMVYATDKYGKRGEFGELILHSIARDFFGAQPAISKIYFKDSDNDTVKGFDGVHLVENEGDVDLWLGEVKFYKDLGQAIRDVTAELTNHLSADFLKREFVAITNKLDAKWPHSTRVAQMLDAANSLDEIVDAIVVPVLLTYESPAVNSWDVVCPAYVEQLRDEGQGAWEKFVAKLDLPVEVRMHLILLPLQNKEELTRLFHEKLMTWQGL